jgi:hypothetical protein
MFATVLLVQAQNETDPCAPNEGHQTEDGS